mmetsp:Transcript_42607/g.127347  ORF Transcript_42607/g.127347 Transcript_42607/m.127347 type:complete len:611 (+) Transcript_42607:117-1949(+)
MEGWLQKRYPLRHGKWHPRWCVLTPTSLDYSEVQVRGDFLRGHITIGADASAVPFREERAPGDAAFHRREKPFGFVLVLPDRLLYFHAADEYSMRQWVRAIERVAEERRTTRPRRTLRLSMLDGLRGPTGGFQGKDSWPVWKVYEQEARLGSGAFGTVFRARERSTGRVVALKQIPASEHDIQESAIEELMNCAQVPHPHILRVFAFFAAPDSVYIACELAERGELLDFLATHRELTGESSIAGIASQVLSALVFLHGLGLVHHGVKPSNILVTDQQFGDRGQVPFVVLGDFGTARLCKLSGIDQHGHEKGDVRGTPEYCGPEVFEGRSGDRTDVYAMGVTLFELLAGEKPFEQQFDGSEEGAVNEGTKDRFHQMRNPDFQADWSRLTSVTAEGCALVRKMMRKVFDDRPSALECSEDPWFCMGPAIQNDAVLAEEECQTRVDRLMRRASRGLYAKALMNMMATQISGSLLQKERNIFRLLDTDKSGSISVEELLATFGKMGLSQERAAMFVRRYDVGRSGSLGFNEWVGATMFMDVEDSGGLMARVKALFSQLDADGSGSILLEDLQRQFGDQSEDNMEALTAFFREVDTNGDGSISLDEFLSFFRTLS